MTRSNFLRHFLGSLGAVDIQWGDETENKILGTVIYDLSDPDEVQEFVWHMTEEEVPNQSVYMLAKLLHEDALLDIDKISVSRSELYRRYRQAYGMSETEREFHEILTSLEDIEVSMIDDGQETDIFFIHE